ncbi:hypothetical protein ACNKF0_04535 [Nocardioides sp. T5]|uniref:hypothetical protein n=1 Tax=Nocardioides sp. T5 TaxID=3400182 RepID=UPI003A8487E2
METNNVLSRRDAERVLADPRQRAAIVEHLTTVNETQVPTLDRHSILAGSVLDLSGPPISCPGAECMKLQVDVLFKRVWHYFDQVVIVGPSASRILSDYQRDPNYAQFRILEYVDLLSHLKAIGASDLLVFMDKPVPSGAHELHDWLDDLGLQHVTETADAMVERIAHEYTIHREGLNGEPLVRLSHPWWESSQVLPVDVDAEITDEMLHEAASAVVGSNLFMGVADVAAARRLGVPLAASAALQDELVHQAPDPEIQAGLVAFHLELPYLEGVSTKELLQIRTDEWTYFEQFRNSIRLAVRERVQAGAVENPSQVAAEIHEDVIQVDIARIISRLAAAERAWSRKTGASVVVGAVTTTVGLLTAAPLVIGAGVATMAGSAALPMTKYFEDKQQVELEDMYFLWRLSKHDRRHAS